MKNKEFCHLHVHNDASYLDGYGSNKKYVKRAKELGFEYLALTNHGNIDDCVQFQKECEKQGIQSILGSELYIVPNLDIKEKNEKRGHITILVYNLNGWQTLCRWITKANLQGFYHRARVDYNTILNSDLDGIYILTGCAGSFLNLPNAFQFFEKLQQKTDKIYLEIMPHNIDTQLNHQENIINKYLNKAPLIASNDCHYILAEDAQAQEVLLAINSNAKWNDKNRWSFGFDGLHLRTADEMLIAFQEQNQFSRDEIKQAMTNTLIVAKHCSEFKIPKQDICLPDVPNIDKGKENETLEDMCYDELDYMIQKYNLNKDIYYNRLNDELDLVIGKNFGSYFLIVKDFIDHCIDNDIGIGPGRGSVNGSLIAYVIGITEVDPIKYDLPFSRFLSNDRQDFPDIDIDVEKRHREKAIQYLYKTYGENCVCGISTFMTMGAKAAIRDVGRVFEIPNTDINAFAKATEKVSYKTDRSDDQTVIEYTALNTPEGRDYAEKYPDVLDISIKLEGTKRNTGRHAAGVIISGEDLTIGTKCNLAKRGENVVCNWTMDDCEHNGLMKLDVLGLATISVIKEAERLINLNPDNSTWFARNDIIDDGFHIEDIPMDDKQVFNMISEGKTAGVFQLSGRPLTKLCKEMGIDSFNDICAVNALVRPGPQESGMTDNYIRRKHGEGYDKVHKFYDRITEYTYGLVCIHEDTFISMPNGIKKIKDIKQNDIVCSYNGNIAENKICDGVAPTRFGSGKKITLYNDESIILTDDHKILTYNGMKEVKNITCNDLIAIGKKINTSLNQEIDINLWLGENKDVSYLMGYIVGNGCNGSTLCCGTKEKADKLESWVAEKFPQLELNKYFHCRSWYIYLYNDELEKLPPPRHRTTKYRYFLKQNDLTEKSINKDMPQIIKTNSDEIKLYFLAGLIDSDGFIGDKTIHYCTSSQKLNRSFIWLLSSFGIGHKITGDSHIHINDHIKLKELVNDKLILKNINSICDGLKTEIHPSSILFNSLNNENISIRQFAKKYNISRANINNSKKRGIITGVVANKIGINTNDLSFTRIRKIEDVYNQQFYGMSVRDNHNLIGNSIVISNCYQEQLIQIIHKMAGMSLSDADKIRKVIGKKRDPKEFEPYKKMFVEGCREQRTFNDVQALEFWDGLLEWASYGFSKNHSVAYSIISYRTAWLKFHFPGEFFAASLSFSEFNEKSRDHQSHKQYTIDEAVDAGFYVMPPKRGISDSIAWVVKDKILYAPFVEIKGIGEGNADKCLEVKEFKKPKVKGFFNIKQKEIKKTKIEEIMELFLIDDIDAVPDDKVLDEYLNFNIYPKN